MKQNPRNLMVTRNREISLVFEGGQLVWQIFVASAYLVMLLVMLST